MENFPVLDQAAKKTVLRLFTYGLYVVGANAGNDANVFTANWLSQVSFEPPMVALSVENTARSKGLIDASGTFSISILASGHRSLAGGLGKSSISSPNKLQTVKHRFSATGPPVLVEALGYLGCRVESSVTAGDSTLYVARVVEAVVLREGMPLTMNEAGFRHSG